MPDLLLELFSEEIPARMQPKAAEDLRRLVTDGLVERGLTYAHAAAFATPRRLTLAVEGLTDTSLPVREERRGPRADAAESAIQGFLRSTGLTRDALKTRPEKKGDVLVAVLERPGRPAADPAPKVPPRPEARPAPATPDVRRRRPAPSTRPTAPEGDPKRPWRTPGAARSRRGSTLSPMSESIAGVRVMATSTASAAARPMTYPVGRSSIAPAIRWTRPKSMIAPRANTPGFSARLAPDSVPITSTVARTAATAIVIRAG